MLCAVYIFTFTNHQNLNCLFGFISQTRAGVGTYDPTIVIQGWRSKIMNPFLATQRIVCLRGFDLSQTGVCGSQYNTENILFFDVLFEGWGIIFQFMCIVCKGFGMSA